jgi:hypothetical protein
MAGRWDGSRYAARKYIGLLISASSIQDSTSVSEAEHERPEGGSIASVDALCNLAPKEQRHMPAGGETRPYMNESPLRPAW